MIYFPDKGHPCNTTFGLRHHTEDKTVMVIRMGGKYCIATWFGYMKESRKGVLFEASDVSNLRKENGSTYTRMVMVRTGMGLNVHGQWEEEKHFPRLRETIRKSRC